MVKIKDIFVEKRNGEREPFDVSKIKMSIAFATEGQDVNPLHLEASLDQFIKNGIKTSEVQDNIIRHAVQLASPQSPQWLNVAGRALAMQMWADYKLRGKSFLEIVKYNIKKGEYTKELEQFYTDDNITELGNCIDLDRDLEHSHSSLITVAKKYLGRYELNQHMHMVNAMRFGQVEEQQNRIAFVKKLYDMLSLRKISLATPFMSNLRKGGNTSSCFIIALEDDLDSIFDNVKRIAKISKNGGGLGIFLGFIRAKGSSVGGVPNSAGSVTQWVKVINDTLVAVNQSFTGDTLVVTKDGNKKISDITLDDEALTHDGSFKKILKVRRKSPENKIIRVKTSEGTVNVTEEHPVMVVDFSIDKEKLKSDIISGIVKPYWINARDLTKKHLIIKPH